MSDLFNRRRLLIGAASALPLLAAPSILSAKETKPKAAAPRLPYDAKYLPTKVQIRQDFTPGTIVVVSPQFFLYHVTAPGEAIRYGVAVGKAELVYKGWAEVARKVEWPSWRPTAEMVKRKPEAYAKYAENGMPGGPQNPLGARALYLYHNGRDTAIRIHGTTDPSSIGKAVSNGCIRMANEQVMALYDQVPLGTQVFVY
ncbi:L,D-transpeptidase [Paracoccus sp. p4-l81]|uniref:L,D-transpeptidase n=1 Tax=unclassified Paracoccus (in: a-proteobacteria) TaxID=2688777 RepID=UPI0035B7FC23